MSKVYFIEDYHRPLSLPDELITADWLVFNAPRPMPGHICWQGDFMHGIFYSAIAPAGHEIDEFGDRDHMLRQCKALDASLVVTVPQSEIMVYKIEMDAKYDLDPDEHNYAVYCSSYLGKLRRDDAEGQDI